MLNELYFSNKVFFNLLQKYNMSAVSLEYKNKLFVLEVPGLAEKRPSLLRGMTLKKILFE